MPAANGWHGWVCEGGTGTGWVCGDADVPADCGGGWVWGGAWGPNWEPADNGCSSSTSAHGWEARGAEAPARARAARIGAAEEAMLVPPNGQADAAASGAEAANGWQDGWGQGVAAGCGGACELDPDVSAAAAGDGCLICHRRRRLGLALGWTS